MLEPCLYASCVDSWLREAAKRLAAAAGDDVAAFELSENEQRHLLDLARVAAHESGERTNAPLLAYLVGVARGRRPEASLAELVDGAVGET
jgi:Domain of unknown function (DUF6457)